MRDMRPPLFPDDRRMLEELLATVRDMGADSFERRADQWFDPSPFRDMLARDRSLTDKQRSWLRSVYEKVVGTPQYENMISSGKAPRGREVPTPKVLLNLPKKPPGRK